MTWITFAVGTIPALLYGLFITLFNEKRRHQERLTVSASHVSAQSNPMFFFFFNFAGFWIFFAGPRVDWNFLGTPWTGLFYWVSLVIITLFVHWGYRWQQHRKPMPK
jgi:hypothetical protein